MNIKRISWISLTTLFFATAASASPKMITNYQQLSQALDKGDNVSAIFHFDTCTIKGKPSEKLPVATGRFNFEVFSNHQVKVDGIVKRTIATSTTMLLEHPKYGMVQAYGRFQIFEDNSVIFHAAYYDPQNVSQSGLRESTDYLCHLSNGADQNGVLLFDKS